MSKLYGAGATSPWLNFSPQEVASKGEGELLIDPSSMDTLQALSAAPGKPLLITSAYVLLRPPNSWTAQRTRRTVWARVMTHGPAARTFDAAAGISPV